MGGARCETFFLLVQVDGTCSMTGVLVILALKKGEEFQVSISMGKEHIFSFKCISLG